MAFPKLKRQLLICHPEVQSPRDFTENTIFAVNQDFSLVFVMFCFFCFVNVRLNSFLNCRKNGKVQKRGKINLIGRLQLSTEKSKEEENEGIVQLRILRTQVYQLFI